MAGVDILASAMSGANAAFLADLYAAGRAARERGCLLQELFASLNDEARAILGDASGASWAPRVRGAFGPDPEAPAPAKKERRAPRRPRRRWTRPLRSGRCWTASAR
jgi:2-oxoglutarate dehydrogenase E1 component